MNTSLEVNEFHLEWKKGDQKLPVRPNEDQDKDKFSSKRGKRRGTREIHKGSKMTHNQIIIY